MTKKIKIKTLFEFIKNPPVPEKKLMQDELGIELSRDESGIKRIKTYFL
tara:strand:- start:668 stop:814 length:147 start_codon:yes stop_codon:yes gene_type:complete